MNLVTTEWLEKNLNKTKVFDASWHMPSSKRSAKKEYMEKHIVSKLIGAPPGYVGHLKVN